jgi:hypothetical protein
MNEEQKITAEIKQWSVWTDNPYLPPEMGISYIHGIVYGHKDHKDGSIIKTSRIVHVDAQINITLNGVRV